MGKLPRPVPWLAAGESFPPLEEAWGHHDPAPGLLAAGAALDVPTLVQAYSQGIFPWFSLGQPPLWWSPDPSHGSADTSISSCIARCEKHSSDFQAQAGCEIRFDSAFEHVINACANKPRAGQPGTWIVPDMVQAYTALHRAGHAHSVETWVNGELAGRPVLRQPGPHGVWRVDVCPPDRRLQDRAGSIGGFLPRPRCRHDRLPAKHPAPGVAGRGRNQPAGICRPP
jgi:hypothetical protein